MKALLIILTIILTHQSLLAQSTCELKFEDTLYQNQSGSKYFDGKNFIKTYPELKQFNGYYPKEVSINIPYTGKCDEIEFQRINLIRMIGPSRFAEHGANHVDHSLLPKGSAYEDNVHKKITLKNEKTKDKFKLKMIPLKEILMDHPKDKRIWQLKVELFYTDSGNLKKEELVIKAPLIH